MLGMPVLPKTPLRHQHRSPGARARDRRPFQPVWESRTATEWFERALEYKLPMAVSHHGRLLDQHVHRNRCFRPYPHRRHRCSSSQACATPRAHPASAGGTAPRAGKTMHLAGAPSDRRTGPAKALPLEGMRIIDLTMGWAGPDRRTPPRDLGAPRSSRLKPANIRLVARHRPSRHPSSRNRSTRKSLVPTYEPQQADVTLDLTIPTASALLKRLVANARCCHRKTIRPRSWQTGLDYSVLKDVQAGTGYAVDARLRIG